MTNIKAINLANEVNANLDKYRTRDGAKILWVKVDLRFGKPLEVKTAYPDGKPYYGFRCTDEGKRFFDKESNLDIVKIC
jgi:hypothetical protein